jgi:hypothetical protein
MAQAYHTASNFFASQSLNLFIQTVCELSKGLITQICNVSINVDKCRHLSQYML